MSGSLRKGGAAGVQAHTSVMTDFASQLLNHLELEIGHNGSIHAMEIYKHCKSGLLCFTELFSRTQLQRANSNWEVQGSFRNYWQRYEQSIGNSVAPWDLAWVNG